jgi:hypothetical protein
MNLWEGAQFSPKQWIENSQDFFVTLSFEKYELFSLSQNPVWFSDCLSNELQQK